MTMAASIKLTENQKIYLRMQAVMAVIDRARDLELARIGLNVPQSQVLYCLKEAKVRNELMTPMKLSRVLQKQPHTVSALVHRMEAQGLVSTKKDMKRKNWLRVSLTNRGEEALKLWANATEVPDTVSCLSKKEIETMDVGMRKLHAKSLELLRKMQPDPFDTEAFLW
jgi:DNA-binding MarR family transcriptional regulator